MAYPNTSKNFCTSKFCVSTLSYIYIQTLSNYHMAYPNDTHTIESFTCMLTIFLPSHEITITSSDTHTIESFTFSQSHHAADIYSYFFKLFTTFLPFFFGFA